MQCRNHIITGVTDEFMKPIVVTDNNGNPVGKVKEGDVIVFFQFQKRQGKRTDNCSYSERHA